MVVTGAARGQGAAEVAALTAEGATVIATDVLDGPGIRRPDVTDEDGWASLAELVIDGGLTAHVSYKRIADATRG